mmetsp:Transcript_16354/g.37860  ORF Transcript_16354/g.37860 Transcript_16354/m.37860 type:complete len:318 (-) Transcript_16354:1160-2113(-)
MMASIRAGCLPSLLSLLVGFCCSQLCSSFAFRALHGPNLTRYKWKLPSRCNKEYSGFSFTRQHPLNNLRIFPNTVLFGKNKNDGPETLSILRFLQGFSFEIKDAVEAGVETALVLRNKQQRTQWTKDVNERFPWIPPSVVSGCVDGLASAFADIAPKDLQKALKPGGLEKVRSRIEADFVRNVQAQPVVRKLPIPNDDKKKLVEHLVDLSLDFFLKDIEPVLAAPSMKLRVLDRERREILSCMSLRQRIWYRLRYKPKTTIALGLVSLWTVFATLFYALPNQNVDLKIKNLFSFLAGVFPKFNATAQSIVVKLNGII